MRLGGKVWAQFSQDTVDGHPILACLACLACLTSLDIRICGNSVQ